MRRRSPFEGEKDDQPARQELERPQGDEDGILNADSVHQNKERRDEPQRVGLEADARGAALPAQVADLWQIGHDHQGRTDEPEEFHSLCLPKIRANRYWPN